tara:strand:- start:54 stop:1064 length:1011 start_codon:yes stop_codon:yes gene_type:complete
LVNVSLVGFGRVGRDIFRQSLEEENINIVSVSDTADKDNLIYLLKYDSIYGKLNHEVHNSDEGILVNGKKTVFNTWKNADESDWKSLNTDIVILATGKPQNLDEAKNHISKGAKKVFIASTPVDFSNIPLLVSGCNDETISLESDIISFGSNTANAVGPILKVIESEYGINEVFLTTVHGYSNSNRLADVAGAGFRKNRAAGENIIPSITNSSKVIESALPILKDKIASFSMTVPVPDGSTIDLTLNLKTKTTKDEVNSYLEKITENDSLKNIIGFTYDPIVSSDVVGNSLSGIIDGLSTMCIDEDKLKLIIWFDNGWGYASRIIEAVKSTERQFE